MSNTDIHKEQDGVLQLKVGVVYVGIICIYIEAFERRAGLGYR